MNYKVVFFILAAIFAVVSFDTSLWLLSLGGEPKSLIGSVWWIGLTALSVLGFGFSVGYLIYLIYKDSK